MTTGQPNSYRSISTLPHPITLSLPSVFYAHVASTLYVYVGPEVRVKFSP